MRFRQLPEIEAREYLAEATPPQEPATDRPVTREVSGDGYLLRTTVTPGASMGAYGGGNGRLTIERTDVNVDGVPEIGTARMETSTAEDGTESTMYAFLRPDGSRVSAPKHPERVIRAAVRAAIRASREDQAR